MTQTMPSSMQELFAKAQEIASRPSHQKRINEMNAAYDKAIHELAVVVKPVEEVQIGRTIPAKHLWHLDNGTTNFNDLGAKAKQFVEKRAWKDGWCYIVAGIRSGAGKSFCCAYIAHHMKPKKLFWFMPNEIIRASFDEKLLRQLKTCDLLVIDDLDHVSLSDKSIHGRNIILEVVEYRIQHTILPTLMTCNSGRAGLEALYDKFIVRRLWDGAGEYIEVLE